MNERRDADYIQAAHTPGPSAADHHREGEEGGLPRSGIRAPDPPQATRLNKLALVVAAAVMSVTLLVVAFMVGDDGERAGEGDTGRQAAHRAVPGAGGPAFLDRPPAERPADPAAGSFLSEEMLDPSATETQELMQAAQAYAAQYDTPPPYPASAQTRGARGQGTYAGASGTPQQSPEEQSLERAMRSSLTPQGTLAASGGSRGTGSGGTAVPDDIDPLDRAYLNTLEQLQGVLGSASSMGNGFGAPAPGPAGGVGVEAASASGPGAFLKQAARARQGSNYIATAVQNPVSPFEVREGTLLEAYLITGIHSDLPGEVVAQVSRDVYDSNTQQTMLIPRGTRLIGTYDNQVALDQSRLLVAWTRMVFPDGRSVNLPGLASKDLQGAGGLTGTVNRHYWSAFGNALMLAVVGGSLSYATSRQDRGGAFGYPTPGEIMAGSVATELSRVATELLRGGLRRRPTIEIRSGTPFYVFLNGDLALQPYRSQDGFLERTPARQGGLPPPGMSLTEGTH